MNQRPDILAASTPPGIKIPAPNVFVVDDDCDDSDILKGIISEVAPQYSVQSFEKPDELIPHLEELPTASIPVLIILDYNMPKVSGLELLALLKKDERFQNIPVVIYSNSNYPIHKQQCLEAGACMYLTKSSSIESIQEDVQQMLSYCS